MTVAKVTEITATSTKSFQDALASGIERANKTLKNISTVRMIISAATVRSCVRK